MPIICPRCHSDKVESKNYARRTGGAIGTAAGAASAMGGAEIGAAAGMIAGPLGSLVLLAMPQVPHSARLSMTTSSTIIIALSVVTTLKVLILILPRALLLDYSMP
ncbi:MAG: hypothetical protein NVS3B3_14310 [Aquirhabdus sp.]